MPNRAARILLEAAAAHGLDAARVALGLPFELAHVQEPRGRLSWDAFVALNDRVEALVGPEEMVEIGRRFVRVPAYETMRAMAGWAVSVRTLHRLGARYAFPGLFPHLRLSYVDLPDGRFVATAEIPPPFRPSAAFFRVCYGSLIALPTLLGEPPGEIAAVIEPRRAVFTMRPGRARTLGDRVRGVLTVLSGPRAALDVIARQREEVREGEAAVLRSQREFHSLLERLPDGVTIHRQGRILWANEAMLRIVGLTDRADAIGRHMVEFLFPADRAAWAARMAAPLGEGVPPPPRAEVAILHRQGKDMIVEVATAQAVEFEGRPARLVVCRDVTAQRRMQEQLALADRMATLGTVAASVAHEMNNPLAYVRLNLEILARAVAPSPAAEESLTAAREGLGRVNAIVQDLRMLSRGNEDAVRAVDVTAALETALRIAAKQMEGRARLERAIAPVPAALGNEARLGQVFLNLLLNAVEAIPRGAPAAHAVRVRTGVDGDGRVVVDVSDTGGGIPDAIRARIFEPFFTTKPPAEGTGLGLAICRRIVTGFGGELAVVETSPRGTTFRVALPAAPRPVVSPAAPPARVGARRARLLIVDDEPGLRQALRRALVDHHDVVIAASGAEALAVLRDDPSFDLVVCDLMMAEVSGMDVYESLRRDGLHERLIFMTGGAFTPRARAFLADVPNQVLEKPFDFDALLAIVAQRLAPR